MSLDKRECIFAGEAWDGAEARAIFDSIGLGVLTVNNSLVISFANKKACEIFNDAPPLSVVFFLI